MKMEAESGVRHLQAREPLGLPELEEKSKDPSLESVEGA